MSEPEIIASLASSGPAGLALVFLGVMIRAWVLRLTTQVDVLAERVDKIATMVQARDVEQAKQLARLEYATRTNARDIEELKTHLNGVIR